MTGLIEQIFAKLHEVDAKLTQLMAASATPIPQVSQYQQPGAFLQPPPPQQYQQPVQQPYQAPVQQPVPTSITGEMLQGLIIPHIDNAAVKEALGGAMRAMGIDALPNTQPHQYVELYQRFQGVLAQFGLGGAGAGQQPSPQPPQVPSII